MTAGLKVTLYLNEDGEVLLIDGDTAARPGTIKVTGMVLTPTLNTAGKLASIALWHDNKAETFTAAATVAVTKDGHAVAANQIAAGQTVELTLTGGKITAVEIDPEDQRTAVEGTVTRVEVGAGFNPDPAGAISIIPEGGGVPDMETYEVARELR